MNQETGQAAPAKAPRKRLRAVIGAIVVVVVLAAGGFIGYSVYTGDIAPSDAAAKYSGLNYLPESDVCDYIVTYREQMGLSDSSDEDWATFLAAYNLTPARLRYTTINQLLKDRLVEAKASELGLVATDEEVDASIATLRDTLALGSDDILRDTLASHGQTEEGLREVYRQAIVQRMVLSAEVEMPDATDDEVREFMKAYDATLESPTVKHTYCLRITPDGYTGTVDRATLVQQLRNRFADGERTAEAFAALVREYGNDAELAETGGANGWNADASAYSSSYADALAELDEGDVSGVISDGDAYEFIWVSDSYTLPTDDRAIDDLDVAEVPASLWSYLKDSAAYRLWESAGRDYIDQLLEEANVVYYPMPENVPYNVDMSLADVQLAEVGDEAAAE